MYSFGVLYAIAELSHAMKYFNTKSNIILILVTRLTIVYDVVSNG